MIRTNEQKPKADRLENLELNRETVQDLSEPEADQVKGGNTGTKPASRAVQPLATLPLEAMSVAA